MRLHVIALASVLLAACGSGTAESESPDAGASAADAGGAAATDAGSSTVTDAGSSTATDAGSLSGPDAGNASADAGNPGGTDAGQASDAGSASGDGGNFALVTGTYLVTNVRFTNDNCALNPLPTTLDLQVTGTTVKVLDYYTDLAGTRMGDGFSLTGTFTYDNRPDGIDCVEKMDETMTGTINADNTFSAVYTYSDAVSAGTECTQADLGYPIPCTSTATFSATKQ